MIDKRSLFTRAHQAAHNMRDSFETYRAAFSAALKELYARLRRRTYSDAVKAAAKYIADQHHFNGRNRKIEARIAWKLDQMGLTSEEKRQARDLADDRESNAKTVFSFTPVSAADHMAQYATYCA